MEGVQVPEGKLLFLQRIPGLDLTYARNKAVTYMSHLKVYLFQCLF